MDFILDEGGVRIVRAAAARKPDRGRRAIEQLRRQRGHVSMSTDEIMALTRGE